MSPGPFLPTLTLLAYSSLHGINNTVLDLMFIAKKWPG